MLRKNFPKLQFVRGAEAFEAFADYADLMLHDWSSLVAQERVAQWRKETGKPYGVYGITLPSSVNKDDGTRHASLDDEGRAALDDAKFLFLRDTISLKMAQEAKLKCPIMEFGPDGAFAVNLRNDEAALAVHEGERPRGRQVHLRHPAPAKHAVLEDPRQERPTTIAPRQDRRIGARSRQAARGDHRLRQGDRPQGAGLP